jgi:lambda repressor-like predicted transcriptional regulator
MASRTTTAKSAVAKNIGVHPRQTFASRFQPAARPVELVRRR